jgi:hypothetical protein
VTQAGADPAVPPPPPPAADLCPVCATPVRLADERCPACNMALAGVGARPAPFNSRSLWFWAAGLLVLYLVVLAIVGLAR